MSSGFITSSIDTSADEFCPDSFTEEVAICECSSIIPEVKCLPVASITIAFLSVNEVPILAIFPFLIKTSVCFKTPSFSFVQTVAFLNKTVSCFGKLEKP